MKKSPYRETLATIYSPAARQDYQEADSVKANFTGTFQHFTHNRLRDNSNHTFALKSTFTFSTFNKQRAYGPNGSPYAFESGLAWWYAVDTHAFARTYIGTIKLASDGRKISDLVTGPLCQ